MLVFAVLTAAFPGQMTRWQVHGSNDTAQIEPSRIQLIMTRLMGVLAAAIAVFMLFGSDTISL